MNDGETLYTVREVAAKLRVTEESVKRWLRSGKLSGFRPGGPKAGWRIPSSAVDALVRGRDVE